MKRLVLAAPVLLASLVLLAGPAWAAPSSNAPVQFTPGGEGFAHPHKVHTPSGCVSIGQVFFKVESRGLHKGAEMSGPDRGPWHVGPIPGGEPCP